MYALKDQQIYEENIYFSFNNLLPTRCSNTEQDGIVVIRYPCIRKKTSSNPGREFGDWGVFDYFTDPKDNHLQE